MPINIIIKPNFVALKRHFNHLIINPIIEVENNHKFSLNAVRSSHELARPRTKVGLKKLLISV